ncbi:MAG: hypothetical protein L3K18_04120 [Thermoplasmata archaeon]|nr:hypothetical protein [Thermoplasmata archaeon]
MTDGPNGPGIVALLALSRSLALLRSRIGVLMVTFIAVLYGFISLLAGGMLLLTRTTFPTVSTTVVTGQGESAWWNYPALIVSGPDGVLALPFLPTVTMVVVSIGVGIGMSVGLILAYRLLRKGGTGAGRSAAFGSVPGLTPALIALVTLGACCSTTAAATAGIGVVAQASGTTTQSLLLNTWYLNLFQVAVLWVALVAQEQLLSVYGRLVRPTEPSAQVAANTPVDPRFAVGAVLRAALVAGGVTWALAMVAEWAVTPSPSLTAGLVAQAFLLHLVPALFAVAAGLFAVRTYAAIRSAAYRASSLGLRVGLFVGGVALATWVPPPLSGVGVYGLGNEILGSVGAPSAWGAVAPPTLGPLALALRWGLQFALLGGFAVLAAVSPERAFLPLQWTTEPRALAGRPERLDALASTSRPLPFADRPESAGGGGRNATDAPGPSQA